MTARTSTSTVPAGWSGSGGWLGLVASARGSAHPPGVPNQDAVLVRPLRAGGLVAVVADGHGGARYLRSDVGARLAAETAARLVQERPDADLSGLAPVLVERWRATVGAHAARHPLPPAYDADPWVAYGSTVLVAVARGETVSLLQLGDGDALLGTADGAVRPVPTDPRLVADETTSLCLSGAATDVRCARAEGGRLVVLASDGLGKSFADPGWWSMLVEDYQQLVETRGPGFLARHLPGWLADSAAVAGDDTTVAVLYREPQPISERNRR